MNTSILFLSSNVLKFIINIIILCLFAIGDERFTQSGKDPLILEIFQTNSEADLIIRIKIINTLLY